MAATATASAAHYPSIKPELVELTSALHGLAHDAELRAQYVAGRCSSASRCRATIGGVFSLDLPTMVKMGAHPLVPFLAQLQIQRLRPQR